VIETIERSDSLYGGDDGDPKYFPEPFVKERAILTAVVGEEIAGTLRLAPYWFKLSGGSVPRQSEEVPRVHILAVQIFDQGPV
jgi:hypothetical protein